jgi:subtilisin family serine protease
VARRRAVPLLALVALAGGLLVSSWAGPVGAAPRQASPVPAKAHGLEGIKGGAARTEFAKSLATGSLATGSREPARGGGTPTGPASGPVAVLLELDTQASSAAYAATASRGRAAAKAVAQAQRSRIAVLQRSLQARVRSVAPRSRVLYESHALLAGLAVRTDAGTVGALRGLPGVKAVHPIVTKHLGNAGAVPLLGAPGAWQAFGDLGQDVTVGVIDSGIDYTHADFGGPGTLAAFTSNPRTTVDPAFFPTAKVAGGYDFAGDDYNADPGSTDPVFGYQPVPHPDPNPIDCRYAGPDSTVGHGTHVAGTLGGYGVNPDGSTYTGPYDSSTPFGTLRIGPGVAPRVSLYGLRVFGCAGSTNVVGQALEFAADPNGDSDFSDRLDVVNMSLGSDFGSPEDGDSLAANALARLGTVVVASAGNGADVYDVGGSPGNARRVLAAAGVDDGFAVLDALRVTSPAGLAGDYAGLLSVLYDYLTRPGVTGRLSEPLSDANRDGCAPFGPADAAKVNGRIAVLYALDFTRCGSIGRTNNAQAAGAIGVVIVDDDGLETGINGNANIPAILVGKSTGDRLAPALASGVTATFGPATKSIVHRSRPQDADKVYSSSSRGTRRRGNVKPDVAAVGVQVFSADSGSGGGGRTLSGTSMSSPQVAGTAALVRSRHPDWSAEEVKADIMNTAGKDVFTGDGRTGDRYPPNRVGAGRVDVPPALANQVVAYVLDDPGAVSVSFGPVAVTRPTRRTKTVKVVNKGVTPASYALQYQPLTSVPGVGYELSASSVSLAPRGSTTFQVTLTVTDPAALAKTVDPTVEPTQSGVPRQFLADASGRVALAPVGSDRPALRVPVYSAPRPASVMTTPATVRLPAGPVATRDLPLLGRGVSQGGPGEEVLSLVSGYALAGTSGRLRACTPTVGEHCVAVPEDRGADLRHVGVTSDAPAVQALGGDPIADSAMYFAVSSWGPWRTRSASPASRWRSTPTGTGWRTSCSPRPGSPTPTSW